MIFLLFHLLTIDEKGEKAFKGRLLSHYSSCLIPAILSPSSSLKIFSCPLFSVKELHRPSPIVLLSLTPLILTASLQYASSRVSQPLRQRKLFKIRKNNLANTFSFVQHKRKHLLNRWSRRVCLLIGYPLASLNLATFAIELYCSKFCKERTWWQELSDKRIATVRTNGGLGGRLWRYFCLVVFVSSCMTCSPLLLVQRHTSESDIDRSSNRSWQKNFDTRLSFSSANKIFREIVKDEFHPIRQK